MRVLYHKNIHMNRKNFFQILVKKEGDPMDRQAVTAFLMSLIAGLSTGLGGLIVVFSDGTSTAFLSLSLIHI